MGALSGLGAGRHEEEWLAGGGTHYGASIASAALILIACLFLLRVAVSGDGPDG